MVIRDSAICFKLIYVYTCLVPATWKDSVQRKYLRREDLEHIDDYFLSGQGTKRASTDSDLPAAEQVCGVADKDLGGVPDELDEEVHGGVQMQEPVP